MAIHPHSTPSVTRTAYAPYQRFDSSRMVGRMTLEEWTDYLAASQQKSDYVKGEVILMACASPEHNLIQMNTARAIGNALEAIESECDVFGSDQKVFVAQGLYYFPDVSVVCGAWKVDHRDGLQNPILIAEILSPTTEIDDRTDKFRDYQQIASLQHYVLIAQDRIAVTHFEKRPDGYWAIVADCRSLNESLAVRLGENEIVLPLSRLYRRVELQETTADLSGTA